MENPINALRLRAILGSLGSKPGEEQTSFGSGQDPNNPLIWHMQDASTKAPNPVNPLPNLYGAENSGGVNNGQQPITPLSTANLNRFLTSIGEMPTRESAPPSGLRKVMTGLVGAFQGPEYGNQFLNRPYTEKLGDWAVKNRGLYQAAELERLGNAQQLNDEYRDAMIGARYADINQREQAANQRAETANKNAETNRMRVEAAIALNNYKRDNPDWDIVKVEGGNYHAFNPKTKEMKDLGIKTGTLTEKDEIDMRIAGAIKAAMAPRTVYTSGNTTTTTITPGTDAAEKPAEEKVRLFTEAQKYYNQNPKDQKYINLDEGTNEFRLTDNAPDDVVEAFNAFVYKRQPTDISLEGPPKNVKTTDSSRSGVSVSGRGNVTPPAPQNNPVRPAPTPAPVQQAKPARMTAPDGKVYDTSQWSDADIQTARQNGFK